MFKEWAIQLSKEIADGYIRTASHPDYPLTIYNYSTKTQLEGHWNDVTKKCRGLVLDKDFNIVIECIPKFFNLGEENAPDLELLAQTTVISEKLDGYYISIKLDSKYGLIITSRGSFDNKYVWAVEDMFKKNPNYPLGLFENYTYFCELCQNFEGDEALIVAKHEKPRLVCWALRDDSGNEITPTSTNCPFEIARRFSFEEAGKYLKNKVEGVVAYNSETQERVKIKTEWYLEMHRLISNCTKKKVWEILSSGQSVTDLDIPDEYMKQMVKWQIEIMREVDADLTEARKRYTESLNLSDKEYALNEENPYFRTLVFFLRKNQSDRCLEYIYKKHKPTMV